MKKRSLIFVATLLCSAAALAYAGGVSKPAPHVGAFTLKKNITIYKKDGTRESRREIYRRASDGSFRIIETDGQTIFMDRGFAQGRGFLTVDYGSKTLWRHPDQVPNRPPVPVDPKPFLTDPNFVGTDTILGRTAYRLRFRNSEGGVDTESWYRPETGGVPVKHFSYRGDGSIERAAEPYSLDFEEPNPTFVRLPDFPAADPAPHR